ncbi:MULTISPECIES: hypothetical protein [Halococcus]|uniref:Uncharacterized protein n=1 Tax=Halococcus salifodinae DSM 8989 TaxID=1227456 RepID=M0MQT5_9EURY|nr:MULTISPECIES: hypothetical protein [Halococcus]EMA48072.1 hypothetical protein C450_20391 [Halococcus salifodinae DSM 8989]
MNVEYITTDGERGRYTDVSYFHQDRDGVGFFNGADLGFVQEDTFVTYAGPGHTGDVPAADEESMEDVMAELRAKEHTTDGMLIVGSGAHSPEESSENEMQDGSSIEKHRDQ